MLRPGCQNLGIPDIDVTSARARRNLAAVGYLFIQARGTSRRRRRPRRWDRTARRRLRRTDAIGPGRKRRGAREQQRRRRRHDRDRRSVTTCSTYGPRGLCGVCLSVVRACELQPTVWIVVFVFDDGQNNNNIIIITTYYNRVKIITYTDYTACRFLFFSRVCFSGVRIHWIFTLANVWRIFTRIRRRNGTVSPRPQCDYNVAESFAAPIERLTIAVFRTTPFLVYYIHPLWRAFRLISFTLDRGKYSLTLTTVYIYIYYYYIIILLYAHVTIYVLE